MKLTISKSKNAEQLYICKSIRINKNKTTSQIAKKLGSMAELLPRFDNDRDKVLAWAKEQAKIMTEEEKASAMKVAIEVSETKKHSLGEQVRLNCGYLFLKKIYHQLGLDRICNEISKNYKFQYDLSSILSILICTRITDPSSKKSSYEAVKSYLEQPSFQLYDIYRSLDVFAKNSEEIQAQLYENSLRIVDRNTDILYYDCTNFFFEIQEEKGMREYGKGKDHKPNPIIQMGLFLDGKGYPLTFTMFPGKANEQPTLKPLEKRILHDFKKSKFVVCTDSGLAGTENRKFNTISNRSFIVTQSLKKLKQYLRDWALSPEGWKTGHHRELYNIEEINEELHQDAVFYKERWIKENGLEQRLIVTYSLKYKNYMQAIRNRQIDRAEKIIERGSSCKTRNPNSPTRFLKETSVTTDGEIAEKKVISLDRKRIESEEMYDGFYAVCTTLEDDPLKILKVNKYRWQIEDAFRTMKKEFRARPVNLQLDQRIEAHFLTCFIALLVFRILENRLEYQFSAEEIIHTLRKMQVHKVPGLGYLSSYTRTELTDKLHESFGFHTDTEFISDKTMKKILKEVKKG